MEIKTIKLNISKSKPERTLTQFSIQEMQEILGQMPLFPYLVKMQPGGQPAGNHYHKHKQEIFLCVEGRVQVTVENPQTKERAAIILSADQGTVSPSAEAVVIPAELPHVVKNIGDSVAGLLVFATHPAREPEDDFDYPLVS